jgi:hypothetical protein
MTPGGAATRCWSDRPARRLEAPAKSQGAESIDGDATKESGTMKECQIEGTMAFAQRSAVEAALRDNRSNLSHAARQLRVGRTTLYRLLKRFEIEPDVALREPPSRLASKAARDPRTSVRLIDGAWYLVSGDGGPR